MAGHEFKGKKYSLYPNGFLGRHREAKINKEPPSASFTMISAVMEVDFESGDKEIVANPSVDELYKQLIRNDLCVHSFAYHQRVAKVALNIFGTRLFDEWCLVQLKSQGIDQTRLDFIDDCINLLYTGKRNVQLSMWESIIDGVQDRKYDMTPTPAMVNYFNLRKAMQPSSPRYMHEVIGIWMSMPNGTYDLVRSLHVLFGERGCI
jgi:hypothetical protein